ncbi:MAG TPA: twin-arginine translocase subunit TatC [Streptosporangiaceae bacterium]|jgi:sec-independent protein translocase protein TatC|nr:twin-arginine translocase subunit TatC [Streptosporangiaceae bacterium]
MAVADDGSSPDLGLTRRTNPDARMPLMEHIRELRNRVIKIALAVTAGSIAGWLIYNPVWDFIKRPYCKAQISSPVASALAKSAGALSPHCQLYVTGVFDPLVLRLQISIAVGVIISSPIWLYQIWAFIAPGLFRRERRWAYYFVGAALPLFAIGATIAYFAMTRGLEFLLHLVPADTTALITINTYLSYAGAMLAIFGIAFELPLVFVLLNLAGVLTHARFRKWRRMIIFLVFAFAAIFTPSPDPLSMLALAVPCVVLVEASEVFAWANDRRRARNGNLEFPGLTDEEVAQYGLDKPLGEETRAPR